MNVNTNTLNSSYIQSISVNDGVTNRPTEPSVVPFHQSTEAGVTSTSISERALTLSPAEVNAINNTDIQKKDDFKDIVYIWVVKNGSFPQQEGETPILNVSGKEFLNNAIAHAKHYNVKILFFDKNVDKQKSQVVRQSFINLQEKFNKENIRITLVDSDQIIADDEFLRSLIMTSECTGVSVDLLKMYVGANLAKLGLDKALIADFDTELPDNLSVFMNQYDVFPMIEKKTNYRLFFNGYMNHYIENIYFFVKGGSNHCFQSMISRVKEKEKEKAKAKEKEEKEKEEKEKEKEKEKVHLNVNDVYTVYVCNILRELTGCPIESLSDKELLKKYSRAITLSPHILDVASGLKISYERGGTWKDNETPDKSVPVNYKQDTKPVYERDFDQLFTYLLSGTATEIINCIESLLLKGLNLNQKEYWINSLQRVGNVLEFIQDRLEEEKEKLAEVFRYLDSRF